MVAGRAVDAPGERIHSFAVLFQWLVALVLLAGVLVLVFSRPAPKPPPPLTTGIQIVVSPHPDDELEGWARIRTGAGHLFTVFVVMTHGEMTGDCDHVDTSLDVEYGERPPSPMPGPHSQGTPACGKARLNSWNAFLDDAAATLPHGERRAQLHRVHRVHRIGGLAARVRVGRFTARIALDGGDGELTADKVREAVRGVARLRGTVLPDRPVRRLVAAAYYNDSPEAGGHRAPCSSEDPCDGSDQDLEYEHPDHLAVRTGVASLAGLARHGAWLVTHPHDVAATDIFTLRRRSYHELMGLGPAPDDDPDARRRLGAQQVDYGWLSFPDPFWITGDHATAGGSMFPRVQYYIHVPPHERLPR